MADGTVRCIDSEIPFDIPESWEWCRLQYVVQLNPKNKAADNILAGFIPMEKIEASYLSAFDFIERKWGEIKNGFTHFSDGDVAFAKITPCFQNRKSMILKNLPNGIGAGSTELKVLRTYGSTILAEYLLYFLESAYFVEEATFKGTANQQRIISGYLENKLFPLPPIAEQFRITAKIAELLPICDRFIKSQDALDKLNIQINANLRKSILQEAIQGRLVPQIESEGTAEELLSEIRSEKLRLVNEGKLKKSVLNNESRIFRGEDNRYYEQIGESTVDITEELPFEIPENWVWGRLGTIANLHIGKTPPRGEPIFWSNGKWPWVSISDIRDSEILTETKEKVSEEAAARIFKGNFSPKGSLIMSFKLTIGKVATLGIDAFHNEAIITIRPYSDSEIFLQYLKRVMPIFAQMGDSKDAIKGKTLNSTSLSNLYIPIPPSQEQRRIEQKISVLFHMMK